MDSHDNNDYVNQTSTGYSIPGEAEPAAVPQIAGPSAPDTPLTWRDAAGPILALALSLLYWRIFGLDDLAVGYGPGLGIPAFVLAYFTAVIVLVGPRFTRGSAWLTAACLALAVSCALFAYPGLTVLNCFVILLLAAMTTFSLSGQSRFGTADIRDIPEAIRLSILALFTRIDKPFRDAARLGRKNKGAAARAVGTVLVTVILLAAVLALLASADMVFGSFFTGLRERWEALSPGTLLWRVIRTLGLAALIASGLVFIREPAPEVREKAAREKTRTVSPFLAPALALDLVYIVFCAIQLRYLFGGAETASMAGGWAAYARAGFFQLSAVAGINLILCLAGTDAERFAAKGGLVLRIADGLMLALTVVILASAWYRMHLYISAFGLSVLRLMTLWGMLAILAGLFAAGWKLAHPTFAFWRVFFSFALATWCLMCLAGPARQVADYNVDAYLAGRLETVDVSYLRELSADAWPALDRLAEQTEEFDPQIKQVRLSFVSMTHDAQDNWTAWKLSFRALKGD